MILASLQQTGVAMLTETLALPRSLSILTGVAVVLVCLATTGCGSGGPALAEVTGKVSLDGQPLSDAVLSFQPTAETKGSPSFGKTDASGNYRLQFNVSRYGAVPGMHLVKITTERQFSDEKGNDVETKERLPAIYHDKSKETREVKTGPNQIDFALESKPRKVAAR